MVLTAGEQTVYAAETDVLTVVRVEDLGDGTEDWTHQAFIGRYTLQVVLWRFGDEEKWKEIYSRPEPRRGTAEDLRFERGDVE